MKEPGAREWRLPGNDELDKDQDAILEADEEGPMLVTGGPGTGKTTIALIRAKRAAAREKKVAVLLYNNTLVDACGGQIGTGEGIETHSALGWAKGVCRDVYTMPPGNGYAPPWQAMEDEFYTKDEGAFRLPVDSLVVDEGQDLCREYYEFLDRHAMPVTVTADDNQRFTDHPTVESDIVGILGVEEHRRFRLKRNYRNTVEIANFAALFHRGSEPPPPPQGRTGDSPILLETDNVADYLVARFAQLSQRKGELTAIVTRTKERCREYYKLLRAEAETLGLAPDWISTYVSGFGKSPRLQFNREGIMVLCASSCKGLEFDNVFVVNLEDFPLSEAKESSYTKMYVLCTRARHRLVLVREKGRPSAVVDFLEPHVGPPKPAFGSRPQGSMS